MVSFVLRIAVAALPLMTLAACATATLPGHPDWPYPLQQAAGRYPPLIMGPGVYPADGTQIVLSCPRPGGKVEQRGGPTMEYLGADPSNPDLCVMRIDGQVTKAWYGIWDTSWPGVEQARPALARIIHGRTGDVEGFDTIMLPGVLEYHDLIRNEGIEDIILLDRTYRAVKISHYREGYSGNTYRSVSTVWKDLATGLLIYGTYQHISGTPVIDDPLGPTAITVGR